MMRIINTFVMCAFGYFAVIGGETFAQDVEWELRDSSVGVGTGSPEAKLHVKGNQDAKILVENTPAQAASGELFEIRNNGGLSFKMINTNASPISTWKFVAATESNLPGGADSFRIAKEGFGPVIQLFDTGNATLRGALTENSDVNAKQDIEEVNQRMILAKVMELPISEWSYRNSPASRHIGPMAQDFHKIFSLGHTDKGIASIDTAGVALAAIQGLYAQFEKSEDENSALKLQLQKQEERIKQLETKLSEFIKSETSEVMLSAAR